MNETRTRVRPTDVVIGRLEGFADDGAPLVLVPEAAADRTLPARSTVPLGPADLGAELAVLFEGGDPERPLVIGRLLEPPNARPRALEARLDGETVLLEAAREIELRCGKASITLTHAGEVLIRGAYVSSRSSGVNKIKGASVQLN
jgi:hypothetical protein